VHFDAHLDTWQTYFGAPLAHGTPFRRAAGEGLFLDVKGAARHPAGPRRHAARGRADVVEAAPAYDHAEVTTVAAAHVCYELPGLMALGG
jgi:arginase family enzyme